MLSVYTNYDQAGAQVYDIMNGDLLAKANTIELIIREARCNISRNFTSVD